jgi:hypothetical protein
MRATISFSCSPTRSTVAFDSFSLTSWSFFSRCPVSDPLACLTARSVTSCACSSSMRVRNSPICSRIVPICCSRLPISCWVFTSSATCSFSFPVAAVDRNTFTSPIPSSDRMSVDL